MGTELLRLAKQQSRKLTSAAPVTYWSLLSQLYHAHKSSADIEELAPIIRERNFDKLLDLADLWSSLKYKTAYEHFVRNQFAYLAKKYILPSRYNPEMRAVEKFDQAERICARTNRRFSHWCIDTDFGVSPTRVKYNRLLRKMRGFIAHTIGDEPNLHSILEKVGFGPGASLGVSGTATNAMRKLTVSEVSVTPRAATYFASAVSKNLFLRRKFSADKDGFENGTPSYWLTSVLRNANMVRYNKLAFVLKTAKILRVIAVEPLGNSVVQKGADLELRLFLKRIGIDLSDQTRNQEFARIGSLASSREIATIDLVSASDTKATQMIRCLFPPAWFEFLNSIRSEAYELNGEIRKYSKFSSMGNGTTFPLETLVFVAACVAVGCGVPGRDFTVYGDDIAIPSDKSRDLLKLLRILGFTHNRDKTFVEGPFRESCGEDWFSGVSVRPFVLDYALDSVQNIYKFLNQTKKRPLWGDFFQPVREFVQRLLPERLRLYRPFPGRIDGAIDAEFDVASQCPHVHYLGNGVWKWRELVNTPRKDVFYLSTQTGMFEEPPDYVMWYGVHTLTRGTNTLDAKSLSGPRGSTPWFTLRRSVKTAMTWESHGGATSNWLPHPARNS
jgi:hypothetical protein